MELESGLWNYKNIVIEEFKNKIFTSITKEELYGNEGLLFITNNNEKYLMIHDQNCCENVYIDDIVGDLDDLLNNPILLAEEVFSDSLPAKNETTRDSEGNIINWGDDSWTWTFYKFATIKGYVDIKWYGTSNGYYSEFVSIYKIDENGITNS